MFAVAFSPDSQFIVTASADQLIKLWRIPPSASASAPLLLKETLKGGGEMWHASFSQDGTHLISASKDQSARLWPVSREGGKPVLFDLHGSDNGFSVVSSRHGRFWSWGPGRTVQGTDFRTGVPGPLSTAPLEPTTAWVPNGGIRYLRGDGVLYGCATNGEMTAWDLSTGQSTPLLTRPPSPFILGVVTNQERLFVLVRNSGTVKTEAWLAGSTQACSEPWTRALAALFEGCPCVQSPDGKLVAGGEPGGTVMVTTLDDPPLVRRLIGHKMHLFTVAFSADSRWLGSVSWDSTARIWDLTSGQCVHLLRDSGAAGFVQITPDGRTLVTATKGGPVRFWNMKTGQEMMSLTGDPMVGWPYISAWVVAPESDDGLLVASPDWFKGRFTSVPSLRAIDAEIRQGLRGSP